MRNIVLARIDDRLIHGQVVTAWIKLTNGNRIVIVDDPLSKDAFMQKIYKAASPPGVSVEILGLGDAINFLKGDGEPGEKVVVLAKGPQTIEAVLSGGIPLGTVILGGMGANAARKKFYKNVSASADEVACFKRIMDLGSPLHFQLVPDERPVDVKGIL